MGNREALLEASLDCLLEKGYASTTARDVAGRAGTSLAAIGYHFGSLEALLHEGIAEGFRRWRARLTTVIAENAGLPADELLEVLGEEVSALFDECRPLMGVFLEALAISDQSPEVREHIAALYREERLGTAALIRALRGEERDDEMVAASFVLAAVDGLMIQTVVGEADAPTPREFLDLIAPLILERPSVRRSAR